MKYIFDFDDVLFSNSRQFKSEMFALIASLGGVSEDVAKAKYKETSSEQFSLRPFLASLGLDETTSSHIYDEVMGQARECVNKPLLEEINRLGRENCFIVTHGVTEWQKEKIEKSGIKEFFDESNIYFIPETETSKKTRIKEICSRFKDEQVMFVDDKKKYLEDLDEKEIPNLVKKHLNLKDSPDEARAIELLVEEVRGTRVENRERPVDGHKGRLH